MKTGIKIIFTIFLILSLAYLIACGIGNAASCKKTIPDAEKAEYTVFISSNKNIIYTDVYSIDGSIYTLHGYYEYTDGRYRYRDAELILDEKYFGPISIRKRG